MAAGGGMAGGGTSAASDPRWLAAGAGGLLSAALALWAFRGMPLNGLALLLVPMPLFAAGLGFGPASLLVALAVAVMALLLSASNLTLGVFLAGFGVPVAALGLAYAARRGDLALPLALLGLLPALGILATALAFAGTEGGLEGAMRQAAESVLSRAGLPAGEGFVELLVRVKAAVTALWLVVAVLLSAAVAGRMVSRAGLAPAPAWSTARLPGWYPALPALAGLFWLLAPGDGDAVPLSVLIVLLAPLFLLGLVAAHRRSRAVKGRRLLLGTLYALLLILLVPTSVLVTGFGLYEHLADHRARRGAPPPSNT